MKGPRLILVLNLIYLQCIWQLKSQWTDIWYEDGTFANSADLYKWTTSDGLKWAYNSPDNCFTGTCICMEDFEWMSRQTDITSYSQLRLKYDLTSLDQRPDYQLFKPGSCRIYYAYDSEVDKRLTQSIKYTTHLANQTHPLEEPTAKSTLWLWFQTEHDMSMHQCFWDNIYLQGIPDNKTTIPTTNIT
eukprot:205660_1